MWWSNLRSLHSQEEPLVSDKRSYHYAHLDQEFLVTSLRPEGRIHSSEDASSKSLDRAVMVALTTLGLAHRLGIKTSSKDGLGTAPYSQESDNLLFFAPRTSAMLSTNVFFLRGWKQFQSCIKGFNALGLMAEQVFDWLEAYKLKSNEDQLEIVQRFLSAHKLTGDLNHVEVIDSLDLATWHCFSNRTIVCSTSSNMGISLHEILRLLQTKVQTCELGSYTTLLPTEGKLVIWCPDERADFMNPEKARLLRDLESEVPKLTYLRTYINRQQRDPGALLDALTDGGYFFPTNPQSTTELQNLLFGALVGDDEDVLVAVQKSITDPQSSKTLESLGCLIDTQHSTIAVRRGIEGGIHGLMLPYWLMLEEIGLRPHTPENLETWNQASIGAALAAAVLAENFVANPTSVSRQTLRLFSEKFPTIAKQFLHNTDGAMQRKIVGVFDIANIQSLAQLLGVTTHRHTAGRSTAFVGLGSSSYSNGNRCFEILDESAINGGPFLGRSGFHPATHTLSPVAQALVIGEDIARFDDMSRVLDSQKLENWPGRPRKAEPAGAAALAGLLLTLLDNERLTVFEIAACLREMGFDSKSFLMLHYSSLDDDSEEVFIQSASEEGPYMGQFAKDLLTLLDWPVDLLGQRARRQVAHRLRHTQYDEAVIVYLTGDNCDQPTIELLAEISTCRIPLVGSHLDMN